MTRAHRGLLVAVEGPAGCGKSTTVSRLQRYLDARGYAVHSAAQPSRGTLGEIARHNTDVYHGLSLACLVAADRYHHLDTDLRPERDAGRIVLCDRYVASSYVLQRMDGVPLDFIEALNSQADRPDLVVLLTAKPRVAAARVARRGAHDRFHKGIDTTITEVELYEETRKRLQARGWPVLEVDTTATPQSKVVEHLATVITRLAEESDVPPATA
ncbi:dTMP kinase [Actinokineospora sp. HUAS TT18]|uniref:dTMP kinase n=1 Tax=Actinokineospora sp. HUAS TT18 TaxID=3447451 RepID=UPI003F51DC3E